MSYTKLNKTTETVIEPINIAIAKSKYRDLIPSATNLDTFMLELSSIKTALGDKLDKFDSAFIISKNKRNALYYYLCMYYSITKNKVLDKALITGQTYIDQHFMNEDKDKTLYEDIRYSDIAFISLSQYDYTNQYLENLIIELLEFRANYNKITIISYDVVDLTNTQYLNQIKKLETYFLNNRLPIINLTNIADEFNREVKSTTRTQIKQNRRIK